VIMLSSLFGRLFHWN